MTAPFSLTSIPLPANRRLAVHVTPVAERAVRNGHPWLFDGGIRQITAGGRPGDLAVVFDRKRRFLAIGLFDPYSPIRVRILHHGEPETIDGAWFGARVAAAIARRAPLAADTDTSGYRLVHGENDGLPGLVVDRYDATAVVKLYTAAWLPHLAAIAPTFLEHAPLERLVLRLSRGVAARGDALHGAGDGVVFHGPPLAGPIHFRENGVRFTADVIAGQKTGFYLDQRENRARVQKLTRGATVLNVFAYTGGFSLYAARGGAAHVFSLDRSAPALEVAEAHFALNAGHGAVAAARHTTLLGDAFALLPELSAAGRRFDVVVVDPPSLAARQKEVDHALQAYRRLAREALTLLQPGGRLVMASCTARVPAETFTTIVTETAAALGRHLRQVTVTGHPLDHPVGFPEGAYLKCLFGVAP